MRPSLPALLVCSLILAACGSSGGSDGTGSGGGGPGGGGGGGGLGNSTFQGAYPTVLFGGRSGGSSPFARTIAGPAVSAGDGTATWFPVLSHTNSALDPLVPLPLVYGVAADGVLSLDLAGVLGMEGGVSADGALAVASTVSGGESHLGLMLRPSGAYGPSSLAGEYHAGLYAVDRAGTFQTASYRLRLVLDGVGAVTGVGLAWVNLNGMVSAGAPSMAGTYAVGADGTVLVDLGSGNALVGAALAGGSVVIVTGPTTAGASETQLLLVLVRTGSGMTAAALSGSYWVAGIRGATPTLGPVTPFTGIVTFHGSAVADGAGTLGIGAVRQSDEGIVSFTMLPPSPTYVVGPSGELTAGTPTVQNQYGAVSPDGRFAFLAGSTVSGEPPQLHVLVRK